MGNSNKVWKALVDVSSVFQCVGVIIFIKVELGYTVADKGS